MHKQYAKAEALYLRALERGADRAWVLRNLADLYGEQHRRREYVETMRELKAIDADAAKDVAKEYGDPGGVLKP